MTVAFGKILTGPYKDVIELFFTSKEIGICSLWSSRSKRNFPSIRLSCYFRIILLSLFYVILVVEKRY